MKKNKILGGLTLASVLALSGCSYVDNQQSFMDKVTSYIDSQDNQAKQELMDQLKDYLNDEKEMTQEDIKNFAIEKADEYREFLARNYTLVATDFDGTKTGMRVENRENQTHVHMYALNQENEKSKEVYIVVKNDMVYTYLKDEQLRSEVALNDVLYTKNGYCSITDFSEDCLVQHGENKSYWEDYEGVGDYSFANVALEDIITSIYSIVNSKGKDMDMADYPPHFYYENKDGKDIVRITSVALSENNYYTYANTVFEFGENSLGCSGYGVNIVAGIYNDLGETKVSYTFDTEETINFDTVGYTLVTETNKKVTE